MNHIPPMTNPLGKYWNQPKHEAILVDDTHAVMDEWAFNLLAEYSTTYPSGVYPGKMWKALSRGRWVLRWYGIVAGNPEVCSNNQVEILVTSHQSHGELK